MGRGAGERRDLCGVPGDAVERFGDVGSSFQNDVLRNERDKGRSVPGV